LGREVTVPDKVERVVALGTALSFLAYLDAYDLALAVESQDQIPLDKPYMIANFEKAKSLPAIARGGTGSSVNYEAIMNLNPDVVIILSTREDEVALLSRKLKIPVVTVRHGLADFEEEEFIRSITLVGEVIGREEKAATLVSYIKGLKESFQAPPGERKAAYVGGLGYKGAQDITSSTTRSTPMTMAGIRNLSESLGPMGHVFVDREFLLTANPKVIFIDAGGLPLVMEGARSDPAYYEKFSALKNGNSYVVMPHTSYFTNPELIYANALFMAKVLYPELYPDLDPIAKADEIFVSFLRKALYEDYRKRKLGFGRLRMSGLEPKVTDYGYEQK
jgi:iron complex transport system substrate-binding protein